MKTGASIAFGRKVHQFSVSVSNDLLAEMSTPILIERSL